jgi:hypothetical protein
VNVDLAVHLRRLPGGEWVGLRAETWLDPAGVGLAAGVPFDERGALGRSAQALLVDRREAP